MVRLLGGRGVEECRGVRRLVRLLRRVRPSTSFRGYSALVSSKVLSSFTVLSVMDRLRSACSVAVAPTSVVPRGFGSTGTL